MAELPDIGEALAPVLARVAPEHHPLLVALAERLAAERYRAWADAPANAAHAADLRACASREEDIATRVEALYPDAPTVQRDIRAGSPDIDEINRTLFAGRPFAEQFTIQARGERLGAATWRALASRETEPRRRQVLLSCAGLEEASAMVLEAIVG
jgi:hypothetical protein